MTFESRAGRAVQGIHRAVEVMEMSSTKTPQRIARFDQYRERKSRNQRIVAIAVGIAVPVALLFGAVRLLRSQGGEIVPAPPQQSVEPMVSGRTPSAFKAPFTYTVPADWTFSGNGDRYFSLETPGSFGTNVIALSSVVAAVPDCSGQPKEGVGTSSDAMTSWLSMHPALDATAPHPVTLGAATGSYVDVRLKRGWDRCPHALTLVTGHPEDPQSWSINRTRKERYYVLDLPSGDTVTIVITATQRQFKDVIGEAAPIVEAFHFSG
jgi:hypothetical protein